MISPSLHRSAHEVTEAVLSIKSQGRYLFTPDFAEWLQDNWHVWEAFERHANRVWSRGRRHYSARTIIEVMRHESAVADNGPEYRLNNNAAPNLARLYMLLYPQAHGFFEVRTQEGSERAVAA